MKIGVPRKKKIMLDAIVASGRLLPAFATASAVAKKNPSDSAMMVK